MFDIPVQLLFLVSSIEDPPPEFQGRVSATTFWDMVSLEMLSRGLVPCKDIMTIVKLISMFVIKVCLVLLMVLSLVIKSQQVKPVCGAPLIPQLGPMGWPAHKGL